MTIITQPISQTNVPGTSASFNVGVYGVAPIFFQWYFNNTPIAGATSQLLVLAHTTPTNQGSYSVTVSNAAKTLISSNAFLTVLDGADTDGDGISNYWEQLFHLNPNNPNDATNHPSGDQLTYLLKYRFALNPLTPDTDGDSLSDYEELFIQGTNPLLADTDGDGIPDDWEVDNGLNPRVSNANSEAGFAGVTYMQVYQYNAAHTNAQLDPQRPFAAWPGLSNYEILNDGQHTNRFYYDRNDRLLGAEYSRGTSIAYQYDGNGNLVRQAVLSRSMETNGLPVLWSYLNGLTNNTSAYADTDGDGWTDSQEWKAGTNPRDAASQPGLLGNPGLNIASLALPFTPSNFVVGVGQLDGLGAEEIVIGADGNPGTNTNFLLVLTQGSASWQTQRVDVGPFGITSLAVGQVTNRPGPAIYAGLRQAGGTGRIVELLSTGGTWQTNLVAASTNQAAFVVGVAGQDLQVSLGITNAPDGALLAANFSTNWNLKLLDGSVSHRGLGTLVSFSQASLRLLDEGGIQKSASISLAPSLSQGLIANYALNGDATDSSEYRKHGTNINASPTQNRFGSAYADLSFNGSNSYVRVPVQLTTGNPFTWSAWFRPSFSSTNSMSCIMNQGGNPGAAGISPAIFINKASALGRVDFFNWDGQERHLVSQPRLQWDTNTWYSVVVTYDSAGNKVLFINGAAENSANTPLGQTASNFYIGANPAYNEGYFFADIDDVRIYNRALSAQEVTNLFTVQESIILQEPSSMFAIGWRGLSLASGTLRDTNGTSIFYTFTDDKNANGLIDFADDFVTAEYLVSGTSANLLTLSRQRIGSLTAAQSYGLASVNFLNASNVIFFTGEPDGQVFAWTATGATNPLQRQLFSASHAAKAWHALAAVKTLEAGEGLVGLRVDPTAPNTCDVILWPAQSQLPQLASIPNTAPASAVLPQSGVAGTLVPVRIRLWDAEGNASTPFLQYELPGTTNWQDAVIATLDGAAYSPTNKVPALPTGSDHVLVWNASSTFTTPGLTNLWFRVRAQDMTLVGDWSAPMPYSLAVTADIDGDGLPDEWEQSKLHSLASGPIDDPDGDGFANLQEYLADTDPMDGNSYLRITGMSLLSGGVKLDWHGGVDATQYLQRNDFLGSMNQWLNIHTAAPPTPISGSYTDWVGTNALQLFYRIKADR